VYTKVSAPTTCHQQPIPQGARIGSQLESRVGAWFADTPPSAVTVPCGIGQQPYHHMIVAKLSNGKIVRYLKPPQHVLFDSGLFVLVCDRLTTRQSKVEPYWWPASKVAWKIEIC